MRYWIPGAERGLAATAATRARVVREARSYGSIGLPESLLAAVVVANEVLDALPVSRFIVDGEQPVHSASSPASTASAGDHARANAELTAAVRELERALQRPLPNGFSSEVLSQRCLAWFAALAAMLKRGSCCSPTTGLVRSDYYHEQRSAGTLVCHYRHRAHDDPFAYPGLHRHHGLGRISALAPTPPRRLRRGRSRRRANTSSSVLAGVAARDSPATWKSPRGGRAP